MTEQEQGKVAYLIEYIHQVILEALTENEIMDQDEMVMFGAAFTHEWLNYVEDAMFLDKRDAMQYLKQVMESR
jgi:hypothetical protein